MQKVKKWGFSTPIQIYLEHTICNVQKQEQVTIHVIVYLFSLSFWPVC